MGFRETLLAARKERLTPAPLTELEKVQHGIEEPVLPPYIEPEPERPRAKRNHLPEIERKLPQAIDAEKGILGSILLAGPRFMYLCEQQIAENYFYEPRHGQIFTVCKEMFSDNESLDLITLTNELDRRGILEEVGGAPYITELFTFVPTASNASYYIDIVRKKFALRSIIATATQAASEAYFADADPKTTISASLEEFSKIERIVVGEREETEEHTFADLADFDYKNDPNSVLGYRWLCRGAGCLFVGQSGIGKSALAMQKGIFWAQGLASWGVKPSHGKKLKSLYIQAENDMGDMAEMMQGVLKACPIPEGVNRREFMHELGKYMVFHRDAVHSGPEFAKAISRLIDKHQPDLVWVDPLLSYVGDDISQQRVATQFLRNTLNPIALNTGIIWMLLHHTGKPPQDPKARSGWTDHDFSYQAFGSSELVNWARAVNVLRSVGEGQFELRFSKRGKRSGLREYSLVEDLDPELGEVTGATDDKGKFTDIVYLQHAREGIFWEQIPKPTDLEERQSTNKRQNSGQWDKQFTTDMVFDSLRDCGNGRKTTELQKLMYEEHNMSRGTFYRLWKDLQSTHKVIEKQGRWYPVES